MSHSQADERLDLRGVPCPQNTARALMALVMMGPGELLELWLDGGEPLENVPPALALEGHEELLREREGLRWRLWFRCADLEDPTEDEPDWEE